MAKGDMLHIFLVETKNEENIDKIMKSIKRTSGTNFMTYSNIEDWWLCENIFKKLKDYENAKRAKESGKSLSLEDKFELEGRGKIAGKQKANPKPTKLKAS